MRALLSLVANERSLQFSLSSRHAHHRALATSAHYHH